MNNFVGLLVNIDFDRQNPLPYTMKLLVLADSVGIAFVRKFALFLPFTLSLVLVLASFWGLKTLRCPQK